VTRVRGPALAAAALVVAVLIRLVLDPWLGNSMPLVTAFGAVAAAVWAAGWLPAGIVAVIGYFAFSYLFIPPRHTFLFGSLADVVGMFAYLFTCGLIIGVGEAMRAAKVRASQQRNTLRVTLASIGDAVITTDIKGRITYVNGVAASLTGWTQPDAIGQPLQTVFRIVDEGTRKPLANPVTRALNQGVVGVSNPTVLIQKDGGALPIDEDASPIRDEHGHVSGCVLIFRDVTAQRRDARDKAEQLLTARRLAAIVESSDDAMISKSLDGTIQSWNDAAERVFGYTAEEAVGRHISLVIPPDRIAEEDDIIRTLKAGKRISHVETERLRKGGQRIMVSLTVSPINDEEGNIVGASKVVRDITDRKRAEADRQRMADDLRLMAADLSEANRRKTEFLAMLAHELRNPLAPISNAVRALRVGHGDAKVARAALGMFERQVGQLARLVDDLLDLSRATRGKIVLRKQTVELVPIVEQAVEAVRARYGSLDQELTVTLPTQAVYLSADAARLAQVIGNLLNNACKFTDPGGHVGLTVAHEGAQVVIRVRDDGIGIAAEQLPHLFKMFTQADTSLERTRDGLGIGLTLVDALVKMHDGTVQARSGGLGRGSEFEVRLPALADGAATVVETAESEPITTVGRRILIVDDNVDGADSLAMLLEEVGHETHKAHDGVAALDMAEHVRPDVVLLDIGLPRLNGYEVCQRLRERPWAEQLMIVALTGWGQEEDRQRSLDAGFDNHMVKPVDHNHLTRLLASFPARAARSLSKPSSHVGIHSIR
jgi:PAS domain S-box-containing protein